MTKIAALDEGFLDVSTTFKITDFSAYQKLAMQKSRRRKARYFS